MSLMERRAYDIAAILNIKVTFNTKPIYFESFIQYARMFVKSDKDIFHDHAGTKETVILARAECGKSNLSFVNCVWTREGGSHVDYVIERITNKALKLFKKKVSLEDVSKKS